MYLINLYNRPIILNYLGPIFIFVFVDCVAVGYLCTPSECFLTGI